MVAPKSSLVNEFMGHIYNSVAEGLITGAGMTWADSSLKSPPAAWEIMYENISGFSVHSGLFSSRNCSFLI